ncbi:MAG: hypothetical protein QW179_03490 [Candidatus Hadarchaeales archaeon]
MPQPRIPSGELAVKILEVLEHSRTETGLTSKPLSWGDLEEKLAFGGSHGTLAKALKALQREGLIRKREEKYELTFEGRWCLHKGPAEPLPNLPEEAKTLMEIHGYLEPTPTQLEFFSHRDLMKPEKNICIYASPDQGKTLLAEFYAFREIKAGGRVLYLTPYKTVNREKHELFEEVFGTHLGYAVRRVDGDTPTPDNELGQAHIVLATYETAHMAFIAQKKWVEQRTLVVADDIALIGDEYRGAGVDIFLTLLRRESRAKIVALSSRVGNEDSLAQWLSALRFSTGHARPRREYVVIKEGNSIILEHAGEPKEKLPLGRLKRRQVLFDHAKKLGTVLFLFGNRHTAEKTSELLCGPTKTRKIEPPPFVEETELTKRLVKYLEHGVGLYHAGIPAEFKRIVEAEIRRGQLQAVAATPSARFGVGLPSAAVILYLDGWASPLTRFAYEDYIGKAGAGGAGSPIYVYLVTEEPEKARQLLTSGLEDVRPQTLGESLETSLEKAVLFAVQRKPLVGKEALVKHVVEILQATAAHICSGGALSLDSAVRKKLAKMEEKGLLSLQDGKILLTGRGKLMAELGLESAQEEMIRKRLERLKGRQRVDQELLKLALECSWALGRSEVTECVRALKKWIDEAPLDAIISTSKSKLVRHDADVVTLANDAAEKMNAIFRIARDMGLEEISAQAETLERRLRHGVREDLLESDLLELKNMNRVVARRLYKAGFKSIFHIYDAFTPPKTRDVDAIAAKTGLSAKMVKEIQEEVWEKRKDKEWLRRYVEWSRKK